MLMTLVLLCALLSIAGGREALVGVVLVAPAVIGEWANYWPPELLIYLAARGAGLVFIGFVVAIPRFCARLLPDTCYRGSPGLLLMLYWAARIRVLLFSPSARSPANP